MKNASWEMFTVMFSGGETINGGPEIEIETHNKSALHIGTNHILLEHVTISVLFKVKVRSGEEKISYNCFQSWRYLL